MNVHGTRKSNWSFTNVTFSTLMDEFLSESETSDLFAIANKAAEETSQVGFCSFGGAK